MTDLTQIEVNVNTSDIENAGTDGSVYLGICGREFRCDTTADDFERGSSHKYIFGESANTSKAAMNDPRKPRLVLEDVERYPVYVRFEQDGPDGHWNLEMASVFLNGSIIPQYEIRFDLKRESLWLGKDSGAYIYLHKHIESSRDHLQSKYTE